jgi:hypothetical protein
MREPELPELLESEEEEEEGVAEWLAPLQSWQKTSSQVSQNRSSWKDG